MNTKLKRVNLQSDMPDRLGRPQPGLFEVLIDEERVRKIAEKAVVGLFEFSHSAFALDSGSGFAYGTMGVLRCDPHALPDSEDSCGNTGILFFGQRRCG